MVKKKEYKPDFFYEVGDEVIRKSALNEEEAEKSGIDYRKSQVIVNEERIGNIQILYFKANPTVFHNAFEYLPYGETLVKLEKEFSEYKKQAKKKGVTKQGAKVLRDIEINLKKLRK